MMGLSLLGTVHTAISLLALGAGVLSLARDRVISLSTGAGRTYVLATLLVCLTGFGIFAHGGFGKAHVLGLVTLAVLGLAVAAERTAILGRPRPVVAAIAYSATVLFHLIPAVTETTTRLPVGSPLFASPDVPALQAAPGILFVMFVVGAWIQARHPHPARPRAGQGSGAGCASVPSGTGNDASEPLQSMRP